MTDFYRDLPAILFRFGKTADRPTIPPDKHAFFWNIQTGKLYGVNDAMDWVELNPDPDPPPPYTGEAHVHITDVATSIYPQALMWGVPSLGALIYEVRLVIDSAYDPGIVLSVGDAGDNERLLSASFSDPPLDPQTPGTYRSLPLHQYAALEGIYIYCSASTSTGSGTLYMMYDENPNTVV